MKRKAMQHAKMEQMKKKSKMSSSMIGKGITIRNLIDRPLHFRWKKAWKLSGLKTECGAFVLATVRLFLWHLLQPCLVRATAASATHPVRTPAPSAPLLIQSMNVPIVYGGVLPLQLRLEEQRARSSPCPRAACMHACPCAPTLGVATRAPTS